MPVKELIKVLTPIIITFMVLNISVLGLVEAALHKKEKLYNISGGIFILCEIILGFLITHSM